MAKVLWLVLGLVVSLQSILLAWGLALADVLELPQQLISRISRAAFRQLDT